VSILEQVQEDVKAAMKAGERDRVGRLRMVVNALQAEEKEGTGDEIAALQRERKRRLDAAEALREGGRTDQAEGEEAEAKLIEDTCRSSSPTRNSRSSSPALSRRRTRASPRTWEA
jgi:uncharacterized protein YqeY